MGCSPALPTPCLVLITDRKLCSDHSGLEARVGEAATGGVTAVQVREKGLAAGELFVIAKKLKRVIAGRSILIINDRLDVAMAVGADGVHLPNDGLSVAESRRVVGDGMLLGCSVHNVFEATRAAEDGADYLQLGSIFPSRSHPGVKPSGPSLISKVVSQVSIPVLAVGGIDVWNAAEVRTAGASGAAVVTAIMAAPSARSSTEELLSALGEKVSLCRGDNSWSP